MPTRTRRYLQTTRTALHYTMATSKVVSPQSLLSKQATHEERSQSNNAAVGQKTPFRKQSNKSDTQHLPSTTGQLSTVNPTPIDSSPPNASILPYQAETGEPYMGSKQQAHFRQLLLQRKQWLIEELDRTVQQLQNEAITLPDLSDRATQEETFSLELRTRDRERKLIKKLDEALHHLEAGCYGYCDACGGHIGIQRLEARPMATLCIDCKTLDEIKEKQHGEG